MGFASYYLEKHTFFKPFLDTKPAQDTSMIVVIPSFSEPHILNSLQSLFSADRPSFPLEVIVVVNSSENSGLKIVGQNRMTLSQVREWKKKYSDDNFMVHAIDVPPFPLRHAGVGFARKTGMDEAVGRFNLLGNEKGIIVSFDADSTCDRNYFTELEKCFLKPEINGCTIYFEHPLEGDSKERNITGAITEYELYLRYFVQAMRLAGFPYAFHTIGSCFAVNAKIYAAMGGMNRKKAGEDFYFLHKIFPLGGFTEMNSTCVIPSSRVSDRVPFGTGATMKRLLDGWQQELYTYPLQSFEELSALFLVVPEFFRTNEKGVIKIMKKLPEFIAAYLDKNDFINAVIQMNIHSAGFISFRKRFFVWFNALRLLKFLNYVKDKNMNHQPVTKAAGSLLKRLNIHPAAEDSRSLLLTYRELQRRTVWTS